MKLNSKFFDQIRVKSAKSAEPRGGPSSAPACQWKGCKESGPHKAPRGRGQEGAYFYFCIEHVRQFNASYNYFNGMSDAEVEAFQKSALTGHRPTWRLGADGGSAGVAEAASARSEARGYARFSGTAPRDPHRVLDDSDAQSHTPDAPTARRTLRPLERKALETLHLQETAQRQEIKTQFKLLVKRHHPDANGGDRGAEDKLREIIQAYNYLKQAGLV